ncbi:MAG: DUF4097 family beta strand repeat protein [Oscillospiraceae bacterium]|nr:DUF4097 family beta strand repeat protein [Oscillospiraceae bacterium]
MDKLTYLAELAEGLARWVPERERQNILRYYAEYFDEAGPGREAEVVRELGDPWALSCRLAVEGGFVNQEQAQSWTPRKKKKWPWLLAAGVTAAVLLFTVASVAMGAAVFGRLVGRNVAGFVTGENVAVADPVQTDKGAFYEFDSIPGEVQGGMVAVVEEQPEISEGFGFWTMEDGYLDSFDTIDAEISFGNITVTAGTDYTLSIQKEGSLGDYRLRWTVKDGKLKVEDARPGGFQSNWGGLTGVHSLDVSITVPSGVRVKELDVKTALGDIFVGEVAVEQELEVKTALGDVELYGVRAEELEAKSNLGDVECHDSQVARELTLESNSGDVVLGMEELWDGLDIKLKTNLGQVEAVLNCAEAWAT